MRRAGNLFERIATRENLREAFGKAARGKRARAGVREFAADLESRLAEIGRTLTNETIPVGRFYQFLIRDPKERVITAPCFEERVMHHAIINVCEPAFERWLIDDTFACRTGKGREAAVLRAATFARRYGWCLKLDMRKYFDSVPHHRLSALLRRRFKDERLLNLFDRIIGSFRGGVGRGLPIGSLTSQHLANFYLGWFDRFVKEELRVRGYVRYMDDNVLWHDNHGRLRRLQTDCMGLLAEKLELAAKPNGIQRSTVGLNFLGCRIFPTHTILSRRSRKRWRRKVLCLSRAERLGLVGELDLQTRLEAATAFARGAGVKSWRFRRAVLEPFQVGDP
ncbi:MAG: RNA-directed DNA polymerase [Pirellulaceae bacterium]